MGNDDTLNLGVLISGGGTNLQALIDACANPDYPARIQCVVSNRPDAFGLERARRKNIPAHVVDHKNFKTREEFEDALIKILGQYSVDLICLAGFMRILTGHFVRPWHGRIINTHPALLPKHGGPGMFGEHVHRAVLACGDNESGVSIHEVTEECDQGPVILQRKVPVLEDDTAETLAARVLEQEHIAYVEAVRQIAERRFRA
ncbi:MAG: phosphoribosylglycinamide formyltransferase [Alphaproteobacteria bacterium]|nr:phosphoribosylglycinamide formyltransferase [Alphaproteobacteria bacterium]